MLPVHKWVCSPMHINPVICWICSLNFIFPGILCGVLSVQWITVHYTTIDRTQFSTLLCRSTVASAWRSFSTILSWPFWLAIWRELAPSCMHMVLCVHVCGVMCVNVHAYLCVKCAWCMFVCTCVLVCIHKCECLPNGGYKSTSILSVITQVQNKTHTVLAIADFFLVTCLQRTQCEVSVCTHNVVLI